MTTLLQSVFKENYNLDDRVPFLEFDIPNIDGEFSVYAPKIEPWIQLLVSGLLQTLIQVAAAVFIYEAIVKRRGYITSFLIGWGLVIPTAFCLPFYLVDLFDMRNKVLCLGSGTASTVIMFRCIEAMYGTSPEFAELSISNYCSYYGSMAQFVWSKKTKKIERLSGMQVACLFLERMFHFFALSLALSIMIHYNYQPFEDRVGLTSLRISTDLLSFGHICNSYLYTILFYFALNNLFELNAFQENTKGLRTERIFDSPLRRSKTPTEFWTKRWNLMIHRFLKQGIFEPAKQCFSNKTVVVFLTFLVSGLYHEFCWAPVFYYPNYLYEEDSAYNFRFGRVTAFFAYTGIIMLLERPLKKLPLVQWMASHLPTLVISQLLVLLHAPVVKWYGGDWIEAGFFDDYSLMFFLIRKS